MVAAAHQTGGGTSLQTIKTWGLLTWDAEAVTGVHGLQKWLVFFFPKFVHKGLLHKMSVWEKTIWSAPQTDRRVYWENIITHSCWEDEGISHWLLLETQCWFSLAVPQHE